MPSYLNANEVPNPLGLKLGDKLRDNDPRTEGKRIITITRFTRPGGKWYAEYFSGHRNCRVSFDRIYTDPEMRPRSQGYTLVR